MGLHDRRRTRIEGSIRVGGDEVVGMSDHQMRRIRGSVVSMIFQDPRAHVNPVRRIGDFMTEALRTNLDVPAAEANRRAAEMLGQVGIADGQRRLRQDPHELSGGMRQPYTLPPVLADDPQILLMGEPFSALDAQSREIMQTELLRIWAEGRKTVLFITHQIDEAVYLADRVIVFGRRPGRVQDVVPIDLPRPRTLDSKYTPEFAEHVNVHWHLIKEDVVQQGYQQGISTKEGLHDRTAVSRRRIG